MDIISYLATILTIGAFAPQAYKAISTRKTRDLSLPTYATLVVSGALWTIYGIGIGSPALIITNTSVSVLAFVICVMKIIEG